MKKILIAIILISSLHQAYSQVDMEFWDKAGSFDMGAGMVFPGKDMASKEGNGLYANPGFQVYGNLNFIIKYGIGFGFNVEYNQFYLDEPAYFNASQAEYMEIAGGYSSTKVGMNILLNLPVVVDRNNFAINFYAEFNPGLRGFNIPEIDLWYDENINKYVEVHYRARNHVIGYLGYSGGLQLLFKEKWGINMSYNSVLPTRHSIWYSTRMYDAFGELYESEDYLNNYLNHWGWQLGLVFVFGKN